jgi:hypothetical protein
VLEVTIAETRRQPTGIKVIQSFNVVITTIGVEMIVVPNTNLARRGVVIRFVVNLGCGLGGFLTGRNH